LVWAYFLLRYYQYWKQGARVIRDAYKERLSLLVNRFAGGPIRDESGAFLEYQLVMRGRFSADAVISGYDPPSGTMKQVEVRSLSRLQLSVIRSRSAFYVGLHTTHATDSALPFALAIAAPVVSFYTHWRAVH
jgi:hypothetical protein